MRRDPLLRVIRRTFRGAPALSLGLVVAVLGSVLLAIAPPLVLERVVNALAAGDAVPLKMALLYFASLALSGMFDALRAMLISRFGQKITRGVRHEMCAKLSTLPASFYTANDSAALVSRFVGDVDTVETLFASGVVGMFVDCCKVCSIVAVIFVKSLGLGLLMVAAVPLLFWFVRSVQKRMLAAQLDFRASAARVTGLIPETIRCIRTLRLLGVRRHMEEKYDGGIQQGYRAMERSNLCEAIFPPVIVTISSVMIAIMMILAAAGGNMRLLFGMSVGTAVAVIDYVSKVFSPLESIGMEIQNIQSAVAGVRRIRDFLSRPERSGTDGDIRASDLVCAAQPAVEFDRVRFGYGDGKTVLQDLSFRARPGESLTVSGRTGAGKSTAFKLILGLYAPEAGSVRVYGVEAGRIPDGEKRRLFGYVEQSFRPVPGSVGEQIRVFDADISRAQVQAAAQLVGLHEAISALPEGYDTPYTDALFSQGQRQLLSIARAVCADPSILLLDEITANLDSDTERSVLLALQNASRRRTVISISHRLYEKSGGAIVEI